MMSLSEEFQLRRVQKNNDLRSAHRTDIELLSATVLKFQGNARKKKMVHSSPYQSGAIREISRV